jgi:integrase
LDNEERTALLNACEEMTEVPEIKIIVLVAITTGARKGEIMGLHWRHVDLQERRLIFEGTKNGETRAAPLVGPALQVIKEWSKVRPLNSDELVFPGRGQRTSEKPLDIDKVWKEVINKSGINDFRFHDLRHTAASYLAMNGVGLREISDILGHKTLAMVQRYAHLCEDHKRNTMERVAIAVFGDLG